MENMLERSVGIKPSPATAFERRAASSRKGDRKGYSRYLAIDIRNPLFSRDPSHYSELATLYQTVFNGVEAVKSKWTPRTAESLLRDRLSRPGSHIALLDTEQKNNIVGAFFARIAPGRDGWELTEPDVLIAQEYRGQKLGSELGFLGRINGDQICHRLYRDSIQTDISQTYAQSEFPRLMWESHGYKTEDLFVQCAKDLLVRSQRPPRGVSIRVVEEYELRDLAKFVTSADTQSSGGQPWTFEKADTFLRYMYDYNRAIMRVAENGTGIVGLMVGDTIPRRTGASLVNINGFINSSRKDKDQISMALLDEVVKAAHTVSLSNSGLPIKEVEVQGSSIDFFRPLMPSIQLDSTYVGMRGDHSEITNNLKPKGSKKAALIIG